MTEKEIEEYLAEIELYHSECGSFSAGCNKNDDECLECSLHHSIRYNKCKKSSKIVLDSMDNLEPIRKSMKGKKMDNEQTQSGADVNAQNSPATDPPATDPPAEEVSDKKPSLKQWCRDMIAEGHEVSVIKKALAEDYTERGKDEKYARARANAIYGDVSKKLRKDAEAAQPQLPLETPEAVDPHVAEAPVVDPPQEG